MQDRICIVTGTNSGIGYATCEGLATSGATVVMACRDLGRGKAAQQRLLNQTGRSAELMRLDLASQDSIREFASEFSSRFDRLHVLVHNAGVVYPGRVVTEDGFDAQLAVTFLGPFLLTGLLLDRLTAGAPSRIINVASDLHRQARIDFDDLQSARRYTFIGSYAQAELAKILFTYELARRLKGTGVTVNCLHPGGVRSGMFRHFRGPLRWLLWLSDLLKQSPARGARTSLHLAISDQVASVTGRYFVGCKERQSSDRSRDPAVSARLWAEAERLTGAQGFGCGGVPDSM